MGERDLAGSLAAPSLDRRADPRGARADSRWKDEVAKSLEFKALGLDGLHTALARRGRRNWADEYGLEYRNTGGAAPRWTEPRIAATLATLCSGRDTYPSPSDFAAAGLAGLYGAIARRPGGHARRARSVLRPRARAGSGATGRSGAPSASPARCRHSAARS